MEEKLSVTQMGKKCHEMKIPGFTFTNKEILAAKYSGVTNGKATTRLLFLFDNCEVLN